MFYCLNIYTALMPMLVSSKRQFGIKQLIVDVDVLIMYFQLVCNKHRVLRAFQDALNTQLCSVYSLRRRWQYRKVKG